jgi:hypothetical protein
MATPVTALYAGILTIWILILALRVVQIRRRDLVGLGDGGNAELLSRIRIHGNAAEFVPITLLVMLILELNGQSESVLHGLGMALTAGRLAHAQGLTSGPGTTAGRVIVNLLTWFAMLAGALLAIAKFVA